MNSTLKKGTTLPALLTDWLNPVSSFFDRDFFNVDFHPGPRRLGMTVPTVNISETPKNYLLELAAPGLEPKDFKVVVESHVLSISAEKKDEKKAKDNGYSRNEYFFNSFYRSFNLPENVTEENIVAKYKDGILKVNIPKSKETPVTPVHSVPVS